MWSKCAGKVWQCSAETICLHNEKVVSLDKCVNCPRAAIHKYNVERPQRGQQTGVVLGTGTRVVGTPFNVHYPDTRYIPGYRSIPVCIS